MILERRWSIEKRFTEISAETGNSIIAYVSVCDRSKLAALTGD